MPATKQLKSVQQNRIPVAHAVGVDGKRTYPSDALSSAAIGLIELFMP
jgi:hypothetical protein